MQIDTVLFKAGTVIEISFACINLGKEPQLFGHYFPKVMPILNELGGQSLGSFAITESQSELDKPQLSALFQWPSLEAFEALHRDSRFLEIKDIRDNALKYLSNGHFFEVKKDTKFFFIEGHDYALFTKKISLQEPNKTPLEENGPSICFGLVKTSKQDYKIGHAKISSWNEQSHHTPDSPEASLNTFKIQRNFPQ